MPHLICSVVCTCSVGMYCWDTQTFYFLGALCPLNGQSRLTDHISIGLFTCPFQFLEMYQGNPFYKQQYYVSMLIDLVLCCLYA